MAEPDKTDHSALQIAALPVPWEPILFEDESQRGWAIRTRQNGLGALTAIAAVMQLGPEWFETHCVGPTGVQATDMQFGASADEARTAAEQTLTALGWDLDALRQSRQEH